MNEVESTTQNLSRAEAIDARAADWMLAKWLGESWSELDQRSLDAWLAESPAHLLSYWRLEETWSRAQRLEALRAPMRELGMREGGRRKPYAIGLAAVLVVSALLGTLWLRNFQNPAVKTYATPVGGHLTLALADGSKIELNTDSVLSLSTSPASRYVSLSKGEAFFEIKHDASHPFVVSVGNHRITDLGTKFVVRRNASQVRVALLEGKARFETENASTATQTTDLVPGDVVVATRSSMSVSRKTADELKSGLGWQRGVLIFDNTTLAEAASELNRYNSEKISIPDPAVAHLTIGGTFPDNDVTALVNTATQVFKLKVTRHNGEIVITQ